MSAFQTVFQAWRTYGTRKGFVVTPHSLLSRNFLFPLPDQRLCIVNILYIHIYDCIHTVYELPLLPNKNWEWNIFTQIGSGAKCWTGYCYWDVGLAVSWRTRDTTQRYWDAGLAVSWRTRDTTQRFTVFFSNRKWQQLQLLPYFLLLAFLEEAFTRNIRIVLCINYKVQLYCALIMQ